MAKDKISESIKSEINKQRHDQGEQGIGEYSEAPGGGTPASGGGRGAMKGQFEVVNSKEEAEAIKEKNPNAKIRYNQPRDENGQFTYNSANGKGISTKHSRGYTKPPFLAGVDLTFIKKGSTFQYKDENGKLTRVISSIDMTADELVNACKVYFETEGGFLGVIGTGITKKGSPSKVEKTGVEGKTGETDLTTKSQNTQNAVNQAAQNKDTVGLVKQDAISKANKAKNQFIKNLNKVGSGTGTGTNTGSTNGTKVGAGVGVGANVNTQPTQTNTQNVGTNTQKPQQNNTVNLSSLQNSMQNMMQQYLSSKKGDSNKVNQGVSQQGKQNLMNKWLNKKQ